MESTSIVWQLQLNYSYWRSLKNRSDLPRLLLIVITFTMNIEGHISSSIQMGWKYTRNSWGVRSFLDCYLTTVQTVFNFMTHYVLKPDEKILQIYDIGSQLRNNSNADRKTDAEPELSVWNTLPRRNLIKFKSTSKQINVNVKDRIVKLQEERGLMKKLVVISRIGPEITKTRILLKREFYYSWYTLYSQKYNILSMILCASDSHN